MPQITLHTEDGEFMIDLTRVAPKFGVADLLIALRVVLGEEAFKIAIHKPQGVRPHGYHPLAHKSGASQADILEAAILSLGRPASPKQIAEVAIKIGFPTKSKRPLDVIQQVLRKHPRFRQVTMHTWTIREQE